MSIQNLYRSFAHFKEFRYQLFKYFQDSTSVGLKNSRRLQSNVSSKFADEDDSKTISTSQRSTISKAMKAYLERSLQYDKFVTEKVTEYEIGKRHLANMMGENPETFTQVDIENAIAYLLPSALFEPRARPAFKHPSELFAKRKEAEFDESGRPFHSLFYSGRPAYYSLLQEIASKADHLNKLSDKVKEISSPNEKYFEGSKWIQKHKFEGIISEPVSDQLFDHFITSMERLVYHPLAIKEKEFITKFRENITIEVTNQDIPELMYTPDGIPYMTAVGQRKKCTANVTVYGRGSGKFRVNGEDILYFDYPQDREQVMFPLQFTGNLRSVDIEVNAEGGGKSGQAGAIRYGIAMALRSFVSEDTVEKMRIAGLLTRDARKKERKKPGRKRARAKFTWKKR